MTAISRPFRTVFPLFLFLVLLSSANPVLCQTLSLEGLWKFKADPQDQGGAGKWYNLNLPEQVKLPGSMAGNFKGDDISLKTPWTGSIYDSSFYFNPRLEKYRKPGNIHIPFWLTPAKYYVGPAWYQKEVEIPAAWKGKHIVLYLERCHTESRVWVDGEEAGLQNSLVAAHEYDLSKYLSEGKHRITIRIDNRIKEINVGPDSHSITDHTQGNWNGIVGRMELNAGSPVYFEDIRIYPDIKNRKALVKLLVRNTGLRNVSGEIALSAETFNSAIKDKTDLIRADFSVPESDSVMVEVSLPFGAGMQLWDEFSPALYKLKASLKTKKKEESSREIEFGMRVFRIEGNRFLINGRPVFLRGTLNNCEFPLTGYPAADAASWERIFKVVKSHGLNHVRFHSWCPPEAAFKAADRIGIYLQPEGPSWPNHGPKIGLGQPVDKYLYDETERMAKNYGNYASFVMLSAGNEPAGNQVKYLNQFVNYWKKKDGRRVYTGMSVGGSWPVVTDAEFQVRGGVRGLAWDKRPESISDFSAALSKFNVPFVAHEMGQWCVFPNFKEIKKYTGIYRAKNMELFQQDLSDRGMADQAEDFLAASGKLQALCYKNEIEKVLRTPGYAGFQLLGLQDFPGQGTALVGVLDAFWEEKGYISAKEFSRFCNTTVPLARLPKFVFTSDEVFEADIAVSHSGPSPLRNTAVNWVIRDTQGEAVTKGRFDLAEAENGNGIPVGKISLPLSGISRPSRLNLEVSIGNTGFINDWNFWVYPAKPADVKTDIYYTTTLDEKAKSVLDKGGKVFLNAAGQVVKGREVSMHFLPVFWNTSWFKMRPPHVTGMLIQNTSAAFAEFPTGSYSDLQWWDIANRSQVMILEDFPAGFKPLVQPIDTWFLNRRLALVYEARVGKGKLIVSSADLKAEAADRPAARQLYYSLKHYMASANFNPKDEVSFDMVKDIFVNPSRENFSTYTKDSPDELKPDSKQNKTKVNEQPK